MMAHLTQCLRGPVGEAEAALHEAQERLAHAIAVRARASDDARRLGDIVARNHFREAVEFQLRGGGK